MGHSRRSYLPQEPTPIGFPTQPIYSLQAHSRSHPNCSHRTVISNSYASRRSHHHRRHDQNRRTDDSKSRARSITSSRAASKPRSVSRSLSPAHSGKRKRKVRGSPRGSRRSRSLTPVYSGHRYQKKNRRSSSRHRYRSISRSLSPIYSGKRYRKIASGSRVRDHSFSRRSLSMSSSRSASKDQRGRSLRGRGHSKNQKRLSSTRSPSERPRSRNGPPESQSPHLGIGNNLRSDQVTATATPLSLRMPVASCSKTALFTPSHNPPTPSYINVTHHRSPLRDLRMSIVGCSNSAASSLPAPSLHNIPAPDAITPILTSIDSYIRVNSALRENVPPHTFDENKHTCSPSINHAEPNDAASKSRQPSLLKESTSNHPLNTVDSPTNLFTPAPSSDGADIANTPRLTSRHGSVRAGSSNLNGSPGPSTSHAEPTHAASAPRHLQGSTPNNSTTDLVTLSTPLNRAGSLRLNASPRPASRSILARSLRSSTPDADGNPSGTSHAELSYASPKLSRRSLSTDLFTSTPPPNQATLTSLDKSNHRIIETSSNTLVSTSKHWGRHQAELETLLALKRADKVQEVRKRLLRRICPMIPLVQHNGLPWNDLPILCLAKAVQISGIPDCCPLPGFCSSP